MLCMGAWITFSMVLMIATAGMQGMPERGTAEFAATGWPQAATGSIFAMVMGVLVVTTEFQHRTAVTTFLIEPRRGRVVVAKLIVAALVGAVFGMAAIAVTAASLGTVIATSGGPVGDHVVRILLGSLAGYVLYALLGVALGTLLRNQVAALVVGILWAMLLEPLLMSVPALAETAKWLPGSAVAALYDTGVDLAGFGLGGDYLPAWLAVAVMLAYTGLFSLAASVTTLRRDIA
jgi:ABC-type transport system involved in multi-copper enzyme maturation permease subunit